MIRIINWLRQIFIDSMGFSKTESNGMIVLLLIVLTAAIIPGFLIPKKSLTPTADPGELQEWMADLESSIESTEAVADGEKTMPYATVSLQDFDPNNADERTLREAGVPVRLAKNISAYTRAGGQFRSGEDLLKIYGMTDSIFEILEPYIVIVAKPEFGKPVAKSDSSIASVRAQPKISIRINTAKANELQVIRGIGPVLSDRIIKYRDLLGGFSHTDQVREVFGLEPEIADDLVSKLDLDGEIHKIPINETDSIRTLARHPYIDYKLARAIINYRKVHGPFGSLTDLKNIKLMNDSLYQKIAPYLSL